MSHFFKIIIFTFLLFFIAGCENDDVALVPKPRMFPKVDYPEKKYEKVSIDNCNFSFEKPVYSNIIKDKKYFNEEPPSQCWFDVSIPQFSGKINCTYYDINSKHPYDKLKNDAFALANKHNLKANYIDEIEFYKNEDISGYVFDISGPAASPIQFYLTDKKSGFFRGALYFNTQSRPDSLAPIIDFIKRDILHILNTFEWN